MIEERIGDSETEQSEEDISFDEETEDNFFSAFRKRGKHVEKKTLYTAARRTAQHDLLTRLSGVKRPAKNIKDIYSTCKCLFTDRIIEMLVEYTKRFIESIKTNFARSRDANYTEREEIQAFIALLYMAG
ncbi:hypothetical protein HHI36_009011 [Cryptolaemus montrouzieri]|uniref:Uncharacterized protein n=1 Tax=Cryptolaemus montrouzieri TaxID=559131 RepID=A0ABD2MU28_9CUCU